MTLVATSAPGKAILFGEHGVNRGQPALAAAVGPRVSCEARTREEDGYAFRSGKLEVACGREELLAFKAEVDGLLEAGDLDRFGETAGDDFFSPARYVLAHVLEQASVPGLEVEWWSELPVGSGLGSGAAAFASLALAAMRAAGRDAGPEEVASLAWRGDVIAHGGIASGLDGGACAMGGLIRYTLSGGPTRVSHETPLPLVIGDTLVSANTGEVNTRVRRGLEAHPSREHLFAEMGMLVRYALAAIERGDLAEVGHLMNLNHLLLEGLGVSSPEIENLVASALEAGAMGAKLSGSGGGGIVVALAGEDNRDAVAEAMEAAGGRSMVASAGVPGAKVDRVEG